MVFSAAELRVLRSALALVLQPAHAPPPHAGRRPEKRPEKHSGRRSGERPEERAEAVRECLWLAEAMDEASHEADRLRSFLLADLDRYRAALPGSASGYLARLEEALATGCAPRAEDLEALRALCGRPAGEEEARRRAGLLRRCERLLAPSDPAASAEPPASPGRGRLAAVPGPVPTPAEVFPPHRHRSRPSRQALPA